MANRVESEDEPEELRGRPPADSDQRSSNPPARRAGDSPGEGSPRTHILRIGKLRGEGIAPEFLPYVFDRFQQGDASTTRRHGGLGLGLAIVKQLVELHGGSVRVKSSGIGKGTTFTVHLPLIAVYAEPDKERRHSRKTPRENQPLPDVSLANVHVLVVDDEVDARELVKRLLEMAGATVSTAGCASQAIERIFRLVFCF